MFCKMIHAEVGFNILKQRRLKNLTQEEVAETAGMSRTRLSSIERGESSFMFTTLLKIAKVLDVDYHVLLETSSDIDEVNKSDENISYSPDDK